MKYVFLTIVLLLATQLYAQTITAIVNSNNGLSIRDTPSLKAERIGVIPYKGKVKILQSSKEFEQIILSKERQVVGEWKKISFENIEGYVFDKFLNYKLDYKHKNYNPNRQHIDIYTEKEFFDNIGDKRTLNIKAEKLDLQQYGIDNFNTLSKYNFNKRQTNGKGIEVNEYKDKFSGLMLIRLNDLEITSDIKSEIILGETVIEKCKGITFNNLRFSNEDANNRPKGLSIEKSKQVYFTNIDLENGRFNVNPDCDIYFKYCDFNQYLLTMYDSIIAVENCKFYNAEKEAIVIVPTDYNDEVMTIIEISNSFFGFNMNMVNVMEIEEYLDDPYSKLNLLFDENNIIEYNPKYESLQILVPFKS
ncbi:SH3 domain-containing protein [Maribacter sp. BPC-D8]|uniref:SH3 domain-containing protein n=1 Tax=Maribacter sp. BPC-D8 TaxID=3053613 RepID=UPI002B484C7C|nr:SH3 domain-containing protein [Maribacter sp. BPC-D8]WRI31134.1 SH3 domain-containing protein [Maribacter sp. BPC-D8]